MSVCAHCATEICANFATVLDTKFDTVTFAQFFIVLDIQVCHVGIWLGVRLQSEDVQTLLASLGEPLSPWGAIESKALMLMSN